MIGTTIDSKVDESTPQCVLVFGDMTVIVIDGFEDFEFMSRRTKRGLNSIPPFIPILLFRAYSTLRRPVR